MSWDNVNSRLSRQLQSYFIDLDDHMQRELLKSIVLEEIPGTTEEQVVAAINHCRHAMLPPRSRITIIVWMERILNQPLRSVI